MRIPGRRPGRPAHQDRPTIIRVVTTTSQKTAAKKYAEEAGESLSGFCRDLIAEALAKLKAKKKEAEDVGD